MGAPNSTLPSAQRPVTDMFDLLNVELHSAIKQLEVLRIDMSSFKKGFEDFHRGDNFQGKLDSSGQITGLARYYAKGQHELTVFYGDIRNGNYYGPGILLKVNLTNDIASSEGHNKELMLTYILDWSKEIEREGVLISTRNKRQNLFKGSFKVCEGEQNEYLKGLLEIKEHDLKILEYTGEFLYNNFHGQGRLEIPGKMVYEGSFSRNMRDGYGTQHDLCKKTTYIGQFEGDKRNGYGEVIYLNREKVRLKGFWKEGFVKAGDGIYCAADGRVLEEVSEQFITI